MSDVNDEVDGEYEMKYELALAAELDLDDDEADGEVDLDDVPGDDVPEPPDDFHNQPALPEDFQDPEDGDE